MWGTAANLDDMALITVGRSEIVLLPTLAAHALVILARGEVRSQRRIETLTERERDVLTWLAQRMTNKDIAQSLFLSVRTIAAHLRPIRVWLKQLMQIYKR